MRAPSVFAVAVLAFLPGNLGSPNKHASRDSPPLALVTEELLTALSRKRSGYRNKVRGPRAQALVETGLFPKGLFKVNFDVELPNKEVVDFTGGVAVYRSLVPHYGNADKYRDQTHLIFDDVDLRLFREFNDKLGGQKRITRFVNLNKKNFANATIAKLENIGIDVSWMPPFDVESPSVRRTFRVSARMFTPSTFQLFRVARVLNKQRLNSEASLVFCGLGEGRTGTAVAAYEYFLINKARSWFVSPQHMATFLQKRGESMIRPQMRLHGVETKKQLMALKVFGELMETLSPSIQVGCFAIG
eukprot:GEMP01050293.1.p1 GENE.GEMP01050293.1~~GEMP01050293.1.p1  ORF type:complete len:302 (+),score=50.11 GEMP01050293.1:136-1041(+)